ncbi:MAG: hypothetical protein ACREFZ_11970 [Acetobacteraceae bacterium]
MNREDVQAVIGAALAQDREARSRGHRRALYRFEALACAVAAVVLCVLQPWFLIPVALFGLFAMALSENRVASFIGRWSWKAIGYGLLLGAFWLWFHAH